MTQSLAVTPTALFTLFAARMAEVGHAPHRQERTVLRLRQSEVRGGGLDRQAFYLAAATLYAMAPECRWESYTADGTIYPTAAYPQAEAALDRLWAASRGGPL